MSKCFVKVLQAARARALVPSLATKFSNASVDSKTKPEAHKPRPIRLWVVVSDIRADLHQLSVDFDEFGVLVGNLLENVDGRIGVGFGC